MPGLSPASSLGLAYKLAELDGEGRLRLNANADTWPGIKQVGRQRDAGGIPVRDVIGLADEALPGEPLLQELVRDGRRVGPALEPLDAARDRCASEFERLPAPLRSLEPADPPYPVEVSEALRAVRREVIAQPEADRRCTAPRQAPGTDRRPTSAIRPTPHPEASGDAAPGVTCGAVRGTVPAPACG